MFTETKKGQTGGELRTQPNRIEKETTITGDIVSKADFRIDGTLEGTLKTTGKVVIGKSGKINGKVSCVNADIEGVFQGDIQVSELLNLQESASVEGTVTTAKLAVEPGAVFEAQCSMKPQGVSNLKPNRDDELSKEAS
jgi:cytoskeletal protein CcmA (bactofilin family)